MFHTFAMNAMENGLVIEVTAENPKRGVASARRRRDDPRVEGSCVWLEDVRFVRPRFELGRLLVAVRWPTNSFVLVA